MQQKVTVNATTKARYLDNVFAVRWRIQEASFQELQAEWPGILLRAETSIFIVLAHIPLVFSISKHQTEGHT